MYKLDHVEKQRRAFLEVLVVVVDLRSVALDAVFLGAGLGVGLDVTLAATFGVVGVDAGTDDFDLLY